MRKGNETLNRNKVVSGCLGIVITTVFLGLYFLVPASSIPSPAPAIIHSLAPFIAFLSMGFILYFMVRMFLSATKSGNDAFLENISKYLWRFNLALMIFLLVHYFGN
jgi:hypothetical protein